MSTYEKQARNVVVRAKEMKVKISYQQSLELIASINGFTTWAALKNDLKKKEAIESVLDHKRDLDPFVYVRFDYFYSSKDSGSYYVKLAKSDIFKAKLELKGDMDSIYIELAIKSNQMDSSYAQNIVEIEEITLEDYQDARPEPKDHSSLITIDKDGLCIEALDFIDVTSEASLTQYYYGKTVDLVFLKSLQWHLRKLDDLVKDDKSKNKDKYDSAYDFLIKRINMSKKLLSMQKDLNNYIDEKKRK